MHAEGLADVDRRKVNADIAVFALATVLLLLVACRAPQRGDDFEATFTSYDDWFDGSMDTKEVYCRGYIEGRKVFVDICNTTTNDLVINRTSRDFWYAVKYRDSKGESCVFEKSFLTEYHMGWIEVLYEKSIVGCDLCYSTDFSFELPKDCVHVESVAIELRIVHIPEIGKCRMASDLQALFWKNRFRKIVDFGKNIEQGTSGETPGGARLALRRRKVL